MVQFSTWKTCQERNVDYNLRKNDSLDLANMYSRTNSFKYSYFIRIYQ